MPALTSQLDPRSQDFQDNAAYHRALVDELDARLARAADGGGEKARAKHTERGKLLPRDRITALLDPGSPFLEIAPLAAEGMYDDAAPARRHGLRHRPRAWARKSWSSPTTPRSRAAPTSR